MNNSLLKLLDECIEQYMLSATPISSSNLFERIQRARSPATIRNQLKILEEMGYLHQVHNASGGRIPTTRAYKEYYDRTSKNTHSPTFASGIIYDLAELCSIIERIEHKLGARGGAAITNTHEQNFSRTTSFQKLFADPDLQMSALYLIIKEKINDKN